jgi:hypothetical protein
MTVRHHPPQDQHEADQELLALALATDEVAATMSDPALGKRLRVIADEVRSMASASGRRRSA